MTAEERTKGDEDMTADPELQPDPGLCYGPPDKDHCCAYRYAKPGRRCPDHVSFYVKIPDGRGSDWRKARAACTAHLPDVIWQMQEDHGGGGPYAGVYLLSAVPLAPQEVTWP